MLHNTHTHTLVLRGAAGGGMGIPPGTTGLAAECAATFWVAAAAPHEEQNAPFTSAPHDEQKGISVSPPANHCTLRGSQVQMAPKKSFSPCAQ
jgi:hypothetical protein